MLVHQTGLTLHNREKATPGYTLYAPSWGDQAFLIDLEGNEVNRWQLSAPGNNQCEMLPNGNFFVSERMSEGPPLGPGKGGRMREYDWDDNVVWEHIDIDQHHDSRRLANGGTAYIAWYPMAKELHAQVKGGIPGTENHPTGEIYGDAIRELDETGKVKWEHHDLMMGHQHDCQMIENGNILVYANGITRRSGPIRRLWRSIPTATKRSGNTMTRTTKRASSAHISQAFSGSPVATR